MILSNNVFIARQRA